MVLRQENESGHNLLGNSGGDLTWKTGQKVERDIDLFAEGRLGKHQHGIRRGSSDGTYRGSQNQAESKQTNNSTLNEQDTVLRRAHQQRS